MKEYYSELIAGLPAKKIVCKDDEEFNAVVDEYRKKIKKLPTLDDSMPFGEFYLGFVNVLRAYGAEPVVIDNYQYAYHNFIDGTPFADKRLSECALRMDYKDCCATCGASNLAIQYAVGAGIVTTTDNLFLYCKDSESILTYSVKLYMPREDNEAPGCIFVSSGTAAGFEKYCTDNTLSADEAIRKLIGSK